MNKEQREKVDQTLDHQLAKHMTVPEFAEAMAVDKHTVFNHIYSGGIVPIVVGVGRLKLIDFNVYHTYQFDKNQDRRSGRKHEKTKPAKAI